MILNIHRVLENADNAQILMMLNAHRGLARHGTKPVSLPRSEGSALRYLDCVVVSI